MFETPPFEFQLFAGYQILQLERFQDYPIQVFFIDLLLILMKFESAHPPTHKQTHVTQGNALLESFSTYMYLSVYVSQRA